MYVQFTAYTEQDDSWDMNHASFKKIKELCDYVDEWITYSILSGED